MKTQTKIIILLLSVTLIFIAGLSIIKRYERNREELLLKKNIFDKNTLYDRISRLEVSTLEIFAYDTSNTDDMVDFINLKDIDKADRIIRPLLSAFHVDAVWIYNSDLKLTYTTKNPYDPPMKDINIQKDFFPTLFSRSFFCHFFINTPMGIMEIQSAPIQPAADIYRQTPAQGYLFAGRLWDEKYINELSFLTDSTIELLPIKDKTVFVPEYDIQKGILSFSRIRNGWDENPLVQIKIENKTPLTKQLRESSQRQFMFLLCFTLIIISMMTILLVRWINLPLKRISSSLNQEDPQILNSLKNENTEFGNLARLVLNFFNQKSELETSEERFRSVVQTAADAIICINQQGNIVFWNKEAETIFGYTYKEIVNKPAYIILSEQHRKDYENLIIQLNNGDKIDFNRRPIEVSGQKKDGSEFPMELSEASWKTDSGTFVTAIARDISERKHAETQLEKSEKRFRDIVENSLTGRFIVQEDRIVYTNTEQNVLFGSVPDNYYFSEYENIHHEDITKVKEFCDSLLSGSAATLRY